MKEEDKKYIDPNDDGSVFHEDLTDYGEREDSFMKIVPFSVKIIFAFYFIVFLLSLGIIAFVFFTIIKSL